MFTALFSIPVRRNCVKHNEICLLNILSSVLNLARLQCTNMFYILLLNFKIKNYEIILKKMIDTKTGFFYFTYNSFFPLNWR